MLQQLRQHYYWPGMRRDVYSWAAQSSQCRLSKPAPSRAHGRLQKVITGAPLDMNSVWVETTMQQLEPEYWNVCLSPFRTEENGHKSERLH